MASITGLWLPILLSAVFVFVASSIVHMVLRYHWTDWSRLPGEDKARAALTGLPPGNYRMPYCSSMADLKDETFVGKMKEGPNALVIGLPTGPPTMGKQLVQWFVYTLAVGVVTAYVASRTMDAGADYLAVFRVAGTVAFLTYAGASPAGSIWVGMKWSTTLKSLFDGLIYGAVTGGTFGWLWP
ncbi:MAG TPA: hypothetical protein VD788_10235 [Candidatus Polarisedimenticolaceae bacterium]|nr:hypothetical protein [Candidatus Polarisedimenticolaceae bacterium]